jgi:hypothetical protein
MKQLTELTLFNLPVSDLAPLHFLPLQKLDVSQTHVKYLGPLKGMDLTDFGWSPQGFSAEDAQILRAMPNLKTIRDYKISYSATDFWKSYNEGKWK